VLLAGVVAHLVLAANADPDQFDTRSFLIMADALRSDPLSAYDTMRFPYPPAFAPWLLVSTSGVTELVAFDVLLRLPLIVANMAIALLVQDSLRSRGASDGTRIAAVAAVAVGPVFLAISGYHGQIDSVAILPAVAAFWLWERHARRPFARAGVLVGLGAAVKTVPIFAAIPLAIDAENRRGALTMIALAGAVPLIALAPFLLANPDGTVEALRGNQGVAGFGGPSLILIHPDLADAWSRIGVDSIAVSRELTGVQQLIALGAIVVASLVAWRARLAPAHSASLLWLALLATNPNFAWQYLVWGLPFFLLAGFVREVIAFQLVAILPLILFYLPGDLGETALLCG
jgi:Gpi18-like mannosyltransferase